MKIVHLSDLHLGKRLNEVSLLEDQEYILNQILKIIENASPDAVVIAGDIYDRSNPSAEAINLFDNFLNQLSRQGLHIFVSSGNHDSPDLIAFGRRLMYSSKAYMSPVYNGNISPITLEDEYGLINFYMLPYISPADVKNVFSEIESIQNYNDAVEFALKKIDIDKTERNILIAHQFITGSETSDSERTIVGGQENVNASVFDGIDYVALGHLHKPQSCGRETIRYCGSPLKYSFSEVNHKKSVTIVDFKAKGSIEISEEPLKPLHEMFMLEKSFKELMSEELRNNELYKNNYLKICLTDETEIPFVARDLNNAYPHIMSIEFLNRKSNDDYKIKFDDNFEKKSELEQFKDFYKIQMDKEMNDEQIKYVAEIIEDVKKLMEADKGGSK